MSTIGENIKKFRVFRQITQVELGEALGRSKNVVSNWERGDNAPDLDTLEKICRVLKITPNQLFGWEPVPEYERYVKTMRDLQRQENDLRARLYAIQAELAKIHKEKAFMEDEVDNG